MKTSLLSLALLLSIFTGKAQLILFQDFSNSTTGWGTANGSSIAPYSNAGNGCITEYGIVTPGVGGNNPAKVLSQIITPNQPLIEVKFTIGRYDANLTCASLGNFGCPTSVDIIAVTSTYNGTDPIGDGAVIYSNNSGFLLPISGGTVSLIISLPNTLPSFKVFFNFTASNCNQPGTKYILDKFYFTGIQPCQISNTCAPVANNDYFNAGLQAFTGSTLLANVYGTNLGYTPTVSHITYTTRSLTNTIVSPQGGNDFNVDNSPLSQMTFSLLSQTFTGSDANFIFNSDGTFSFLRLNPATDQFFFTYRLTDANGLFDDASVRIDYAGGAPLPVSLINFNVAKTNYGALLSWQTAQEINNKGFEILRKTTGDFEKISFVESKALNNSSSATLNYTFTDVNLPKEKAVYYRLRQVDIDGKNFYSEIRVINNGNNKQPLLIYPNPSHGSLQIVIPSANAGSSNVQVINSTGVVVKTIKETTDKHINIDGLQTGIYIIKVSASSDNIFYTEKLIVQ